MKKTAVITDSNSGLTQAQGEKLGLKILPMPFYIDGELFFEDISLNQEEFYKKLETDADISTSQPAPGDLIELWDKVLEEYEEIVYIPMSSGLSSSCSTALALSDDYDGKVCVVNNQRISVTQRQAVLDALELVKQGKTAKEIKEILEDNKFESSIYIMVDTLKYLKKGGRITPAAAAIGTVLNLKPVLQIQGDKLDAFAKCRGQKQAKKVMINAMKSDFEKRFKDAADKKEIYISVAHTANDEEAKLFAEEIKEAFEGFPEIYIDSLSLSVSCHIGPGSLAIACSVKIV